jgi:WD40 repeat protein
MASISYDGTFRTCDLELGEETGVVRFYDGVIPMDYFAADLSEDGRLLALVGPDSYEVAIWDTRQKKLVRKLEVPGCWVEGMTFVDNGASCFVYGSGGTLLKYDVDSGQVTKRIDGAAGDVRSAINPDDTMMMVYVGWKSL